MSRRILAYDFLQAPSAEELDRLVRKRILEGWHPDGPSEITLQQDAQTGEEMTIYWHTMVKYAATNE